MSLSRLLGQFWPGSAQSRRRATFRNMTSFELEVAILHVPEGSDRWHWLVAEQRRRERRPALAISILALIVAVLALLIQYRVEGL
jgi:hypothetical protein